MTKSRQALIGMIVFFVGAVGCAPFMKMRPETKPEAQEKGLAEAYLRKGQVSEAGGDLVEAVKNYKIALTIAPSNQAALESRKRVEKALHKSAERHYLKGLEFHKEGKYDQARQRFLTALRLWPDYPEVIRILTSRERIRVKRYVIHKVKPGESLAEVAQSYYGDHDKFSIIARYNNLKDATQIQVGQEIKVPEIEGMAFLVEKGALKTEKEEAVPRDFWDWVAVEVSPEAAFESDVGGEQAAVDQVFIYREHGIELFYDARYQEAAIEFAKVLSVNPDDKIASDYAYRATFQMAMALFEGQNYLGAKEQFEASLKYRKDCLICHSYIKKSEDLYKEMHYKRGIQYYGKEQLEDAIMEWELVKGLDPGYKRVEYYINKAKTILQKLEQIKSESSS